MVGGVCRACNATPAGGGELWSSRPDDHWSNDNAGSTSGADWNDPLSWVASRMTLADYLLQQARLSLPQADLPIARYLIGGLDQRGLLSRPVEEVAEDLGVERERVEAVLQVIQTLEPTGIAARDVRECLLIQLNELRERDAESTVAERLIVDQWDLLGSSSLDKLGREVGASADEVRTALCFIRENLNPFPAHAGWARDTRAANGPAAEADVPTTEPDVIIRRREGARARYTIELPKAGLYRLQVRTASDPACDGVNDADGSSRGEDWDRWQELCGRARLFIKSIEQRWETLHTLMRHLVDYQREFLEGGEQCLKPLTRAEVADWMDVHESTISRAVAGKYVELPCGRIVPLEVFFDSAAPVKHLIREFVEQEEECLSDSAIAEKLAQHGYDVARRTVAKYRNALEILPSSLRRRERELRGPR